MKSLSHVRLFAAPPLMGFSRQEYWSGLPFPSPEDLPDPRIKPGSPASQADALLSKPSKSGPRSVSFNFMAAITICSDFGAQKNKV